MGTGGGDVVNDPGTGKRRGALPNLPSLPAHEEFAAGIAWRLAAYLIPHAIEIEHARVPPPKPPNRFERARYKATHGWGGVPVAEVEIHVVVNVTDPRCTGVLL